MDRGLGKCISHHENHPQGNQLEIWKTSSIFTERMADAPLSEWMVPCRHAKAIEIERLTKLKKTYRTSKLF